MRYGQKRGRPWENHGGDRQAKRPRDGDATDAGSSGQAAAAPSSEAPPQESGAPAPSEASVGITEYVSRGAGFSGIIKEQYADFIVQEISLNGEVCRLTDLAAKLADPVDPANAPLTPEEAASQMRALLEPLAYTGPDQLAAGAPDAISSAAVITTNAYAMLENFLVQQKAHHEWKDRRRAAGRAAAPAASAAAPSEGETAPASEAEAAAPAFSPMLLLPAPADKTQRKDLHAIVRRGYPTLESDGVVTPPGWTASVTPAPPSWIQIRSKGVSGGRADAGAGGSRSDFGASAWRKEWWPRGRPDYLSFVLFKQNQDTNSAINNISRVLGVKPGTFTYAGIKDRRACTTQRVTAYRVAPERLGGLNRSMQGVLVGGFAWTNQKLHVGDLRGNRFTLVVRGATGLNVPADAPPAAHAAAVTEAMQAWAATNWAFPNYFGLQRFGNRDVPTHAIGRALLQRRFEDAMELVLRPREGERPAVTAARAAFMATRDPVAALAAIPPHLGGERALLSELAAIEAEGGDASTPGAAARAVSKIEPRLRSLYLHAYQSSLWNRMASARLAATRAEAAVLPGDLVLASGSAAGDDDDDGEEGGAGPDTERQGSGRPVTPTVSVVTPEDVASGRYTLRDVVLPVPGFAVQYPALPGVCDADTVLAMMLEDGFDPVALGATESPPVPEQAPSASPAATTLARLWRPRNQDYRLPGGYRRLVAKATDVVWEVLRYNDPGAVLSLSDADTLEGRTQLDEGTLDPEGALVGLRVSFSLPKSAYATMVLRELMKTKTGTTSSAPAAAEAAPAAEETPVAEPPAATTTV